MVNRELVDKLNGMLEKYPIISLTGPRQSGKTTLAKMVRPDYQYVNLENLSLRAFAKDDPVGFLENYQNGVVIDEAQYVPELFSYLQVLTDERNRKGEYILTGSQNFLMMEQITQSLAGRVAIFYLLPFSLNELKGTAYAPETWEEYILSGSYPRKLVDDIDASTFYDNYLRTYIERDVRQVKNILNLSQFQRFIQLLAGRIGQLFNQQSLGVELGIDNKTVNAWLSVLETSFIAFRLQPYHQNFSKRVVSTPKIYFYDVGLAAHLLGISNVEQLNVHFAKGALYENLIINELQKNVLNQGRQPHFYFWRDYSQNEIDLLITEGVDLKVVEIKSGKTIQNDFFNGLNHFKKITGEASLNLIYGGKEFQKRSGVTIYSISDLDKL
ncbi:ATP-binding protein [Dyadobacter chenwenxiniae]|uniref:ATP-binding protein n=1 Tax=Dyadobacter chenwenxiniae TaxID=2906456 RepID=A0A9X1TEP7_9BACT|nr:ATP-binding protein [Dyadobacter chenwenxiniae]MCF0061854.1 ATP-binding protein [Dyadobacter chenwenxiniae]UON81669.1 ATP-binding protein [Dyadobacter chenwenxiniae]